MSELIAIVSPISSTMHWTEVLDTVDFLKPSERAELFRSEASRQLIYKALEAELGDLKNGGVVFRQRFSRGFERHPSLRLAVR